MVGITYTDASGKVTSFDSSSAKDALGRLERIPGYVNRNADDMTQMLGSGLRNRRKARAKGFDANMSEGAGGAGSRNDGLVDGGATTAITVVTGIEVQKGKIVGMRIRNLFIPASVKMGGDQLVPIHLEEKASNASGAKSAANKVNLKVVSGSRYDAATHQFVNVVTTLNGVLCDSAAGTKEETVFTAVQETVV